MFKQCCKCGKKKPLDQFSKDRSSKDGLKYQCRKCDSLKHSEYYRDNPKVCLFCDKIYFSKSEKYCSRKCSARSRARGSLAQNDLKICNCCGIKQNTNLFNKNKSAKDGFCSRCKLCTKKGRLISKYKIKHKDINNVYKLIKKSKCCICGRLAEDSKSNVGKDFSLEIDHNHETGVIRGLLCSQCNTALGLFKESVDNLKKAINYLQNPPGINLN